MEAAPNDGTPALSAEREVGEGRGSQHSYSPCIATVSRQRCPHSLPKASEKGRKDELGVGVAVVVGRVGLLDCD